MSKCSAISPALKSFSFNSFKIYRLYGHFAFVVNLTYLGLSSYIFAIKRG